MPNNPIAILDTVEGSGFEYEPGRVRKMRGAIVSGLSGDPSIAMEQCLFAQNMPLIGDTKTVPSIGGQTVQVIFLGLRIGAVSGDTAVCQLIYDSFSGAQPTVSIIEVRSFEQAVAVDYALSTREPVLIPAWTNPADAKDFIAADIWTRTVMMTFTEVTVSGIKYGDPMITGGSGQFTGNGIPQFFNHQGRTPYESAVGNVNEGLWRGLDTGFWRINDGGVSLSRYAGWFSYRMSAITRNLIDWSDIGMLINRQTNRKVPISNSDLDNLLSPPYSEGVIASVPGAARVGDYPTISFPPLFGF